MKQTKTYDITKDFKPTGNSAVDAVASCIIYHRFRKIGLKSIHLQPGIYFRFYKWVEENLGRELQKDQPLSFDHVDIEKGSIFQRLPILPERFDDFNNNLGLMNN